MVAHILNVKLLVCSITTLKGKGVTSCEQVSLTDAQIDLSCGYELLKVPVVTLEKDCVSFRTALAQRGIS